VTGHALTVDGGLTAGRTWSQTLHRLDQLRESASVQHWAKLRLPHSVTLVKTLVLPYTAVFLASYAQGRSTAIESSPWLLETTDCVASLSRFGNDSDYRSFFSQKPALNLITTLPMQACCNQEYRT
jgi:hypothetical protein